MAPRYINPETLESRENEILDAANDIVAQQGLAFLTIDKLVAAVSYSKGTVYNHFSSKEDVFTALCNRNMRQLVNLFQRAAAVEGCARDKMAALGFAYMLLVQMNPQSFTLKMNARLDIFEKASPARSEEHRKLDETLMRIAYGVVQQAIDQGELALDKGAHIGDVTFAIYAMSFGTIALLMKQECDSVATRGMELEERVQSNGNRVMDSFGWQASPRDQVELIQYLKSDVFAGELAQLQTIQGGTQTPAAGCA